MTWPNATDYNAAVQNPQLCFRDEDLRQGQAVGDLFGLPRPHSGNFADVYQIQGADGQSWAVKCFTRPVSGLQARYQAISEHLQQTQRAFMVEFHFQEEGICLRGRWHPLVKMRWVEGYRLNEFVCEHLNKPVILDRLAQLWVRLALELRDAGMAHGDLQHGNVLLVPAHKGSSLSLKLIDYDGMFVPALADRPSGEYGHANYQHPRRQPESGYNREMDRFSHLLIYTALRCLRVGGEELWQRYDNQENLLFREEDLLQPSKSPLLHELWKIADREARSLVGHLLLASQGPLENVPMLDELVDSSGVRPLSDGEEARINDLLNDARPSRDRKRAVPPPLPHRHGSAKSRSLKTRTIVRPADPTVDTLSLADTKRTRLAEKRTKASPPPLPPMPRRSAAEIELDARPPADADALAEPLVSRLSHPAWLATLIVIALACFFVINVMVGHSAKEPETAVAIRQPAVEQVVEKPASLPKREIPPPQPPQVRQESAPPTPTPPTARLTNPEHSTLLRKEKPQVRLKDETPNSTMDTRNLTLSVRKPHGRQEKVHFSTVDHLQLAGTLYHGWKGKQGMTVLMLHDLGSNRSSPGWKRLAEALQSEGHTVLTFDFRGHGDSKKVSSPFWKYQVNKYLNSYKLNTLAEHQPRLLKLADFPSEYRPWLIEDIAAARTYLDLRHDEPSGPVNTFNLVLLGAGQASALGSLWLAEEGLRYNATEMGNKILVKLPEKLSVLQAVWIGMADPLQLNPFGIHRWLEAAHEKPVVPITFIFGEEDIDTSTLLSLPIRKKFGKPFVIPGARLSGQKLLDTDEGAFRQIQQYLVKTLPSPPSTSSSTAVNWVPREIKNLRSLWRISEKGPEGKKEVRWFEAKHVGEETLLPVPFQLLGIPIRGLGEPRFVQEERE
jgi:pimeloyl-ACP methyl ester carboxylesterase